MCVFKNTKLICDRSLVIKNKNLVCSNEFFKEYLNDENGKLRCENEQLKMAMDRLSEEFRSFQVCFRVQNNGFLLLTCF